MSQILVITGMHRSGTSLVSSLLKAGGIHVGNELLAANSANPRGFFEDIDFVEFHEDLLNSRGQHYLYVENDFVFEPTKSDKERARQLANERSHHPLWGWKDPRTALFVDFWAQQLPEARFLFVLRHPLDVVCSLLRRGEFEHHAILDAALCAWQTYNKSIQSFYDRNSSKCLLVHIEGVTKHIERFSALLTGKLQLNLQLDTATFRDIYFREELQRTLHPREEAVIINKLYPGLLEVYEQLNASADLPFDETQEVVATPMMSALADLAALLPEPVTLPIQHSLLAQLLSSHAPEFADSKLTNLSQAGRASQLKVDRLWLQCRRLECTNLQQQNTLEQQRTELDHLRARLQAQSPDLEHPATSADAAGASGNSIQQQAPRRDNWSLPGLELAFMAPAQMRKPERVALYSLIFGIQPRNCLEIGTARGGSSAIICGAMDDLGFGKLICVDPAPEIAPELWSRISHRCRMMVGLSPDILPKAAEEAGTSFDFALIDGNHNYPNVKADIAGVLPCLSDQAYVLFHDAHNGDVKRAIDEAVDTSPDLTDCGLMSVESTVLKENGHWFTWAGLRLLRFQRSVTPAIHEDPKPAAVTNAAEGSDEPLNALSQSSPTNGYIGASADEPPRAIQHSGSRIPVVLAGIQCLSGVTTWAERLRDELADHPRYDVRLLHIGPERPPEYDLYAADVEKARRIVRDLAPAILIPNYVWELYLTDSDSDISCLGMCHSHSLEEYYLPLTWYESRISHFIAVSPECAKQLTERIPFRAQDITMLPYGVRVPQELTRDYKTNPLRMIYAGRLTQPQKRVGDFVRLVEHLQQARVSFTFDIVGDGEEFQALQHAMRQWFPEAQVRFFGRLPHQEVDRMWPEYDVFVQTSDFEGMSVSMLDAMAHGVVPVVTAASSGVAGVIEHEKNGFVLPVGDMRAMAQTISRLAADQSMLAATGQAAHRSARAYAMEAYCGTFTQVLDQVVHTGRRLDQLKCGGGFGGPHPLYTQLKVIDTQQAELAKLWRMRNKLKWFPKLLRSIRKRIPGRRSQQVGGATHVHRKAA